MNVLTTLPRRPPGVLLNVAANRNKTAPYRRNLFLREHTGAPEFPDVRQVNLQIVGN